jgi:FMN phosphatase YigB (HAD superfamily)
MKKKIIFLDGDGTIWYPKKTKRTEKPHWIYHDPILKDDYLPHLELTPDLKETLVKLREKDIYLVVVSANPRAEHIAVGETGVMLQVLDTLKLEKEDALMVGDSFYYDYQAAKDAGIDAFWIENNVGKVPEVMPADLQSIKEVSDILKVLE